MGEDVFIRAKKMERENRIAKLNHHHSFFRGLTWTDFLLFAGGIILEIGGTIALQYFFEALDSKIWILFGVLFVITIFIFCSFTYIKNKSHRRVKPKHTEFPAK